MGEAQALLPGRAQGRRPLISPRAGILLLLGAAALCCLAHTLIEADDAVSLVSTSADDQSPAVVQGDTTEGSWIRDAVSGFWTTKPEDAPLKPVRDEDRVSADKAPKVKVDIYMEAACPGCQFFTTHVLVPVMQEEGMAGITDLNVIAAGNAEVAVDEQTKQEVIKCQHGEGECEGNKIISCLAKLKRTDPAFVTTLGCIEEHSGVASDIFSNLLSNLTSVDMLRNNADICLNNAKMDTKAVQGCADAPEGDQMLRENIKMTAALDPKFEYAPWVLVDNRALKDDAYSLKKYICDTYTGPLPAACDSTKLKDYYPDTPELKPTDAASSSRLASEGRVRGSNKLFKMYTGETTQEARNDISHYFSKLGNWYHARETREKGRKAALRQHPHSALMQELLAGEMAAPRRAFLFCAKKPSVRRH